MYCIIVNCLYEPNHGVYFNSEVDYRRHFSCESCGPDVTGGYDPSLNQVVICYNRCKSTNFVQGVVSHELLHMYDACRAELDFNNLEHVACTEVSNVRNIRFK